MKVKFKSYEVKNNIALRPKAKNFKKDKSPVNKKHLGGVKDNRKFENDKNLSESEKIARRMALENMKRKTNIKSTQKKNNLFTNDDDDLWKNDPFVLKAKQIGTLDEGIDESSDEENEDETDKYFTSKKLKGKERLEELIRERKIEKGEKLKEKEELLDKTQQANQVFRDVIRDDYSTLVNFAKTQSAKDFKSEVNYNDCFQKNYETLIFSKKPAKADLHSIKINTKEKEKDNDKYVNLKIKRLKEHLSKEGIIKDDKEGEEDINQLSDESDQEEDEDNERENDDEEMGDMSEDESDEEMDDMSEEENENEICDESDIDLDKEGDESDSESDDLDSTNNPEDVLSNLKKMVFQSGSKRKSMDSIDNESTDSVDCKKQKIDESRKNEIDCLRVLLKMPELRKDILLVLANEMNTVDICEEDYCRKLILAILFQHTLASDQSRSYSPELIGFIRFLLEKAASDSSDLLSIKFNLSHISRDHLNISAILTRSDKSYLSIMFYVFDLLISVINCNRNLSNRHDIFIPLGDLIDRLPTQFYPLWLMDKFRELKSIIDSIRAQPRDPPLRMRKQFRIIELLEPDLEDKFDPNKNMTKTLKEKIKKEKLSLKKAIKSSVRERINDEVEESKKQAQIRKKKTQEIINGIIQI